ILAQVIGMSRVVLRISAAAWGPCQCTKPPRPGGLEVSYIVQRLGGPGGWMRSVGRPECVAGRNCPAQAAVDLGPQEPEPDRWPGGQLERVFEPPGCDNAGTSMST